MKLTTVLCACITIRADRRVPGVTRVAVFSILIMRPPPIGIDGEAAGKSLAISVSTFLDGKGDGLFRFLCADLLG